MNLKFQRAMGGLLTSSALAYLGWGLTMGDPTKGATGPLFFVALMLGGGVALVMSAKQKKVVQANAIPIAEQVRMLLKRAGGNATAAEIAADAAYSYEEVQAELDRLVKAGELELAVSDTGLCVYSVLRQEDDAALNGEARAQRARSTLRQ